MGLTPSLFSLFFDILPLTDTDFAMNLPFAHLAMLSLAKIFTETYEYRLLGLTHSSASQA